MEHDRDEKQEDMLGEIIRDGDDITSQFLNDSGEGLEDLDEETAPVREWREKMMAPVLEP